jgi:hypothetical protein
MGVMTKNLFLRQIAFFFCFSLRRALLSAWSEMSNSCRNSGKVKVCLPCARRASRWYSKKLWGLRIIGLGQETVLKLSGFLSVNLRDVPRDFLGNFFAGGRVIGENKRNVYIDSMEFQTKIIEGNKNPKAKVVWAGAGLLFLAMILMCMDKYRNYGLWLFGVAVVVFIIGAVFAKGDVDVIELSATDIIINPEEIRVGNTVFQVEGYDGMIDAEGYARGSLPGSSARRVGLLNGMNNYLDFKFSGEKQEWQFYLPDPEHVQQLGALFKELYAKRIPFLERNVTNSRTFLFAPVTKRQWEDLMIEHGYL